MMGLLERVRARLRNDKSASGELAALSAAQKRQDDALRHVLDELKKTTELLRERAHAKHS